MGALEGVRVGKLVSITMRVILYVFPDNASCCVVIWHAVNSWHSPLNEEYIYEQKGLS